MESRRRQCAQNLRTQIDVGIQKIRSTFMMACQSETMTWIMMVGKGQQLPVEVRDCDYKVKKIS